MPYIHYYINCVEVAPRQVVMALGIYMYVRNDQILILNRFS